MWGPTSRYRAGSRLDQTCAGSTTCASRSTMRGMEAAGALSTPPNCADSTVPTTLTSLFPGHDYIRYTVAEARGKLCPGSPARGGCRRARLVDNMMYQCLRPLHD